MQQASGTGSSAGRITQLLRDWRGGDERALEELAPLIYGELRRTARRYLNRERQRPTLETRDLVHEACVRLLDLQTVDWRDRAHLFAVAARMMRRILIDRARRRRLAKHGGELVEVRLADLPDMEAARDAQLVALGDALRELEETDETLARVVELRVFGGLDHDEVAAVLNLSNPTVRRHWRLAKSWLHRRLGGAPGGGLDG